VTNLDPDAAGPADRDRDRPGPGDLPADGVVWIADEPGVTHRGGAVAAFLLLFVVVAAGLTGYWVYSQLNPTPSAEAVTFVVPSDSGVVTIARLLEEQKIVTNGTFFRYYAAVKNIKPIRPGEYDGLHHNEPMDKVIERLEAGPTPIKFTDVPVPEGLWRSDTVAKIREKLPDLDEGELAAAMDSARSRYQPAGQPIDGFLFPATYRVTEKQYGDERALVEQMVRKFDDEADDVGLANAPAKLAGVAGSRQLTPYDVLKVASLVEAEAKVPEDRARIARVIYNRLKRNQPLGVDASVSYAVRQRRAPTGAELQVDSPYNLYRNRGLPPTPINSPGAESLRAALNPSTEPSADKWLYYVLIDKEGHHSFSQTAEEHDRKAAEARRNGVF
jgi:UPF0755 protein